MHDCAADRLKLMQRQLTSRVREALDDLPPELAESAIGRTVQAGVLVELAADMLAEQLGPEFACRMVNELAQRPRASC